MDAAQVNECAAGPRRRQNTVRPEHDLLDRGIVRQHCEGDVGLGNELARRVVDARTSLGQRLRFLPRAVVDTERISSIQEPAGDATPHVAEANKAYHRRAAALRGVHQTVSGAGPPTGTAPSMIRSIWARSAVPRWSSAAGAVCSIWLGVRAPTIATSTAGFASVHAIASCPTGNSRCSANPSSSR